MPGRHGRHLTTAECSTDIMDQRVRPTSNTPRALGWMTLALVSFSLVAIAGRGAAKQATTLEIVFYRSAVSLLPIVLWAIATRQLGMVTRPSRLPLHGLRAVTHLIGQCSWLYALTLIPLAQLFALEFTAPLWVAGLAPLLLGERMSATRALAAVLGFIGAIIVVRPGTLSMGLGEGLALLSALGFALGMLCTKGLTSTEPAARILFYMFLIQTSICGAMALPAIRSLDASTWLWICALAACGLTAHYSLVRAFELADSIIVAPMDFFRLPLIAAVGVLLYNEPLDPIVLAGGGVVVLANIINLVSERRRAR